MSATERAIRRPLLLFVVNDAAYFLSHRLPIGIAAREQGFRVGLAAPALPADGDDPDGAPQAADASTFGDASEIREALEAAGIGFYAVPVHRPWLHPWRDFRTLTALRRLYRRTAPKLVHHVTYKPIVHGSLAARSAGVPCVVNAVPGFGHIFTVLGLRGRLQRAVMKLGYRAAFGHRNHAAIFQNPEDRDLFVEDGLLTRRQTALIRGSGVDPDRFRPTPEQPGPPVVVLASRMIRTKGIEEFVEAAGRLKDRGVEARFALVGAPDPGNLSSVSEEELRAWDGSGPVEWWGYRDDMPDVFARAHLVCLPTAYREGLPKVLLEAAAAGRALVATDIPGCREIVRPEENGLLVPPKDPEALAGALGRLLGDAELRRRMGRRSREIATGEFTVDRVVDRTLEVYDALLARAGLKVEREALPWS